MTIKEAIILGYSIASAEYEIDACSPLDDGVIEQGVSWMRTFCAGVKEKHSGDCTNECHSCIRCQSEVVFEVADRAMKMIGE
jgi:hypothetical protein